MREVIPLRERKVDWILLFFYTLNLTFITYIVDLEQLVIADPHAFDYPVWPPPPPMSYARSRPPVTTSS